VSLALANGIRNQNSPFEQILMPGCLARPLSGRATTQQVLVNVLCHPFGARKCRVRFTSMSRHRQHDRLPKYGETRCYIRDPDGYIIEVGQSNPGVAYG
jgi:hypothetical protein